MSRVWWNRGKSRRQNNSLLELNGKVVAMHTMRVHGRTKAQLHLFLT